MAMTWLKPGIWGAVLGGIGVAIIGFSALGWVTEGTAQNLARTQANTAVVAALTPICLAQSAADPQSEKLAALAAITSTTQRQNFVLEAGWATMPLQGTGAPNRPLAASCAAALLNPPA